LAAFSSEIRMAKRPYQDYDLDERAQTALEEARALPPGPEKAQALRKAGILRNAAEKRVTLFAKRGTLSKT